MSRRRGLVLVAKNGSIGGHDFLDLQIVKDLHHWQDVVNRSLRRLDSIVLILGLDAGEVSCPSSDVLLLPQPPESVDLGVMKEEYRV